MSWRITRLFAHTQASELPPSTSLSQSVRTAAVARSFPLKSIFDATMKTRGKATIFDSEVRRGTCSVPLEQSEMLFCKFLAIHDDQSAMTINSRNAATACNERHLAERVVCVSYSWLYVGIVFFDFVLQARKTAFVPHTCLRDHSQLMSVGNFDF